MVALRLVMSASDCEAVPNDTTWLAVCATVLMYCWIGGVGGMCCFAAVLLDWWDGCVCVSGEDSA